MKKLLLYTGIFLCISISSLQAQPADSLSQLLQNRKNGVLFGFLGNAPAFSLNYHRQLLQLKNRQDQFVGFLEVAVGVGLVPDVAIFGGTTRWYPTFPHSLTLNLGKYKHYLEIGYAGMLETKKLVSSNNYLLSPLIGWRYKSNKGFMFRLHFSPWLHGMDEGRVIFDQNYNPVGVEDHTVIKVRPMFGLSLGKNF